MKTLADLKRNAAKYKWSMVGNSYFGDKISDKLKAYREVAVIQSNSIGFKTGDSISWTDWPKAKELEIQALDNNEYIVNFNRDEGCKLSYHLIPVGAN